MSNAIEFNNLSYAYQSEWTFLRKTFVNDLSLTVREGESFGFLGHNGAGKTTSIKCLVGLTKPTKGNVYIFGQNSQDHLARLHIGFLPEQPYFYDNIKASEVVEMAAILKGLPSSQVKNEVSRVLAKVKIEHKSNSRLRNLSKGQVQRVAMAQALVGNPKILILDEPFSGLDPIGRKEFSDLLFEAKKNGTTIFISSHILGDIEFLCDRVAIMKQGSLKGVFDLKDLPQILPGHYSLKIKNYAQVESQLLTMTNKVDNQDKFLYLTFDQKEVAERALRLSVDSGALVEEFRFVHGGLEELFLQQTIKS